MAQARIKKDDLVVVVAGRDKGARGRVLLVDTEAGRAVVEGVNRVKRHQSAQKYAEVGIIEREASIDVSNIMLVDPKSDEPTRIRSGKDKDGKKVRIAVKSGAVLDG